MTATSVHRSRQSSASESRSEPGPLEDLVPVQLGLRFTDALLYDVRAIGEKGFLHRPIPVQPCLLRRTDDHLDLAQAIDVLDLADRLNGEL